MTQRGGWKVEISVTRELNLRLSLSRLSDASRAPHPRLGQLYVKMAGQGDFAGDAMRRSNAVGLDPIQYDSLARFRSALRRFLAFSEAATREAGVTPSYYQALLVIKTHPARAIMVGELAHEMLLKPNGAVQLVDRLSAAGLVVRRQSATDRRSVLVALTARGGALLESLAAAHISELLKQEPLLAESLRRLRQIDH
jgi:DNA-binding MarR family transcriptional regulator